MSGWTPLTRAGGELRHGADVAKANRNEAKAASDRWRKHGTTAGPVRLNPAEAHRLYLAVQKLRAALPASGENAPALPPNVAKAVGALLNELAPALEDAGGLLVKYPFQGWESGPHPLPAPRRRPPPGP